MHRAKDVRQAIGLTGSYSTQMRRLERYVKAGLIEASDTQGSGYPRTYTDGSLMDATLVGRALRTLTGPEMRGERTGPYSWMVKVAKAMESWRSAGRQEGWLVWTSDGLAGLVFDPQQIADLTVTGRSVVAVRTS